MSIAFLITSLIVIVSPGTGAIYTIAAGIGQGRRASLWAAFGCTLGIIPHMLAAVTGLAAVFYTSSLAFEILKYLGVGYLLFMAWATWKETGALSITGSKVAKSPRKMVVEAVLINILNPKLSIFFFAFLPQFVPASSSDAMIHLLGLSGVFMLLTFVVFALYGLFSAAMGSKLLARPAVMTWMRRSFAAAFVALGARLALAER